MGAFTKLEQISPNSQALSRVHALQQLGIPLNTWLALIGLFTGQDMNPYMKGAISPVSMSFPNIPSFPGFPSFPSFPSFPTFI